ncbi:hypothetical protein B0H11DRAFT_2061495 [Mycena galericulata]|nr:hypothetical protein B0H11DRAFT_2061495 [Mycena galericulata]
MPANADIAQELIDTILDFLHDDRASLLSSSLVARKWVPASRHHIFERIVINHFLAPRRGFRDNAHTFLDICASPRCSIIPAIRTVVLNVNTEFGPSGPQRQLLVDIINVLACAPVEKLIFIDHNSLSGQPVCLSWLAPYIPGLQELSYNALERAAEDLFALVSSFPALRTLSLYSTHKGSPTASIAHGRVPHPTFAHLHTLRTRLYAHQSDELLGWLQTAGTSLRLATLDVNVFHAYHNGWGPVTALNALLRANSDSLHHLAVRITYEDSDHAVGNMVRVEKPTDGQLDLSHLTNLRTLRLTSHSVHNMCYALSSLPSTPHPLTALQIDFIPWRYYLEAPCPCPPARMEHILRFAAVVQRPQFARLVNLDLRVPEFLGESGRVALREYFGRWKDSKVMRIEFPEWERDFQEDSWETVRAEMFGI